MSPYLRRREEQDKNNILEALEKTNDISRIIEITGLPEQRILYIADKYFPSASLDMIKNAKSKKNTGNMALCERIMEQMKTCNTNRQIAANLNLEESKVGDLCNQYNLWEKFASQKIAPSSNEYVHSAILEKDIPEECYSIISYLQNKNPDISFSFDSKLKMIKDSDNLVFIKTKSGVWDNNLIKALGVIGDFKCCPGAFVSLNKTVCKSGSSVLEKKPGKEVSKNNKEPSEAVRKRIEIAKELRNQGFSPREIAQKMGVHIKTVRKYLSEKQYRFFKPELLSTEIPEPTELERNRLAQIDRVFVRGDTQTSLSKKLNLHPQAMNNLFKKFHLNEKYGITQETISWAMTKRNRKLLDDCKRVRKLLKESGIQSTTPA